MTDASTAASNYPEQLSRIKANMGKLRGMQPDTLDAFSALHGAAALAGALDTKTKELIALAIAVAARCDGCIAFHTNDVLEAGASREEIAEALGVAVLMGGGPSLMYATHVVEAVEQFSADA